MSRFLLRIFLCIIFSKPCYSANVLVVIPYSVKSHYIMQRPVGIELSRRGHNVTVITPYKETGVPSNYHQVMVSDKKIWDMLGSEPLNLFDMAQLTAEKFHDVLWTGGLSLTELAFQSQEVQDFLRKNNTFDVVVCEQFYQEATNILAHKYSAPLVLLSTFGSVVKHHVTTRNPLQLATVPFEFMEIRAPTSFLGRLRNFYFTFYEYFWWRFWFLRKQEEIMYKYVPDLPQPVPSLYKVQQNASLMLMNSHFSFDPPAAFLPNLVEIGGLHLSDNVEPLPADLQKLLDEAHHGVVYVNFGSNVKSSDLPPKKKLAFINVFRRLNQTVLRKWEDDMLINKPDNVVIRQWLPQKEILSHPNVKVFLSHGGLIGTQEAVFHGVPIIGVPVYGDQYNNLLQAEQAGIGKILLYPDIDEEILESVLREFLNEDKYKRKAKELSSIFRDRPMKPLDTAVYWIEYVIRHRGAGYMKNPALKLSWVAYNMFDVYAFMLLVTLLVIFGVYKIVKVMKYVLTFPLNLSTFREWFKTIKLKLH